MRRAISEGREWAPGRPTGDEALLRAKSRAGWTSRAPSRLAASGDVHLVEQLGEVTGSGAAAALDCPNDRATLLVTALAQKLAHGCE